MAPLIIPVFLPHLGCREHCLFCNQRATAQDVLSPSSVQEFIMSSLTKLPLNSGSRKKQVAFYGGSFTAMPREDQVQYLNAIHPFLHSNSIDSIRISTRPDALDEKTLSLLKTHRVKTIEIGAQSMIDEVLLLSRRGHRTKDTLSAVTRLKRWNFEMGIHLMMGLPGDTSNRFLQSLDQVIILKPDFVRIHPTLVLKGSSLETLWRAGRYSPLSLDEAIKWLKKGLLKLEEANIHVARIGLQPTRELERHLLAGPYHPALHQLIDSEIAFDMARHLLQSFPDESETLFVCNPKDLSTLKGQRNGNMLKLRAQFELKEISIEQREDMPRGAVLLQTQKGIASIQRGELTYHED
jgi:histone acetyltransferase (RNA polymerase elongator complex component)